MSDQLADRARKAAEEIRNIVFGCGDRCNDCCECEGAVEKYFEVIDRHIQEWVEEKNKDIERIRRFNESEIQRFVKNHKEAAPCPEK